MTGQVNVINGISVLVLDTNFLWWRGCTPWWSCRLRHW